MIQPSVNWKTEFTRYSTTKKDLFIKIKKKDCNPDHADMVNYIVCPQTKMEKEFIEGKRKLRGGAVTIREVCCKHQVLPIWLWR